MSFFRKFVTYPAVACGGQVRPMSAVPSRLVRCYDRHLQRLHLAELDDHMLNDIGLTREEIVKECRKPFWR